MFIIVLGQHVSILTESSSGPSKKTNPYLKCVKNALWDPKSLFVNFKLAYLGTTFFLTMHC